MSETIASFACCLMSLFFVQQSSAQDDTPDEKATKLIGRIQSLTVTPAPADAKKFKIYGTVLNPEYKPARGMVGCWSVQENEDAVFLGKADTNIRGQFSMEIESNVESTNVIQLIGVGFNHRVGWAVRNTTELDSKGSMSIVLREMTGVVEGNLLAPGNKPMAGVELSLEAILESPGGSPGGAITHFAPLDSHTISDENGHFVMEGLPTQVHALLKVKSKEWTSNKDILMTTSADAPKLQLGGNAISNVRTNPADIKLYPRCEVTGTVVDREGRPVVGVRLASSSGGAMTNDEGEYTLIRPDLEAWGPDEPKVFFETVVVIPPKNGPYIGTFFLLDAAQIAARSIKPCVLNGELLSGRLLSAANQKPLANIRVQVAGKGTNMVTGADGEFRLPIEPGQREVEFTPQWMTRDEQAQFLADPDSKAKTQLKVVRGQPVELGDVQFNLDPFSAKPLKVKVVKSDGQPVAGCRVEFAKSTNPGKRLSPAGLVEHESIVDSVLTDKDGFAIVKPASGWGEYVPDLKRTYPQAVIDMFVGSLVTGSVMLTEGDGSVARWSGSAEIVKIVDDVVEVKLAENVRVTGRVLLNGRPLMGANISGYDPQAALERRQSIDTDSQGNYEFIVEPPVNAFRVTQLRGALFGNGAFGLGKYDTQVTDDPTHFVVPDIEVVSGSGKLRGTVVDENGKPVSGAYVGIKNLSAQIWLAAMNNKMNTSGDMPSLITKTNSEGKFVFSGLHDAEFPVVATDRKNETWKDKARITVPVQAKTGDSEIEIVLSSVPKDK